MLTGRECSEVPHPYLSKGSTILYIRPKDISGSVPQIRESDKLGPQHAVVFGSTSKFGSTAMRLLGFRIRKPPSCHREIEYDYPNSDVPQMKTEAVGYTAPVG